MVIDPTLGVVEELGLDREAPAVREASHRQVV